MYVYADTICKIWIILLDIVTELLSELSALCVFRAYKLHRLKRLFNNSANTHFLLAELLLTVRQGPV